MVVILRFKLVLLVFISATLISGCTASGSKEFELYNQAYEAQSVQADLVLTEFAKAERARFARHQADIGSESIFDPNDAAYYIDTVEPPLTASLRATLRSAKAYNNAMTALANGESAAALSSKIATFLTETVAAVATLRAVADSSDIDSKKKIFAKSLDEALAYMPAVKGIATVVSREEFRRSLVKSSSKIEEILVSIRDDATPLMYEAIELSLKNREDRENRSGLSPSAQAKLVESKKLLAGWVLLIDGTRTSLAAATAAASNRTELNLTSLTNAAVELRVTAEQIKIAQKQ